MFWTFHNPPNPPLILKLENFGFEIFFLHKLSHCDTMIMSYVFCSLNVHIGPKYCQGATSFNNISSNSKITKSNIKNALNAYISCSYSVSTMYRIIIRIFKTIILGLLALKNYR